MKDFDQLATKSIINFRRTVEVATIVEPIDAVTREMLCGSHDGRARHCDVVGDPHARVPKTEPRDREKSQRRLRLPAATSEHDQEAATDPIHQRYISHEASFVWLFGNFQTASRPRLFPSTRTGDRHSCAVI